jgi:hypothetical protein
MGGIMELGNWWTSVAGIAAAASALTAGIRFTLGDTAPWNKVPVVVYVVLSCIGLSALAQYVMEVALAPTFGQLLVQTVTAALVAVGGVSLVSNLAKPMAATTADARNKFVVLLAIGLTALGSTACATRDGVQVSPEGTLALRGRQFVAALNVTVTPVGASPIEQLVAAKRLSAADGAKVADAVKLAMQGGEDLAAILKLVDDAKTDAERQSGLAKASALVQSIATGLETAKISVLTEDGRQAVVGVLRTASMALLMVGSLFPAPAPGAPGGAAFAFGSDARLQTFTAAFGN